MSIFKKANSIADLHCDLLAHNRSFDNNIVSPNATSLPTIKKLYQLIVANPNVKYICYEPIPDSILSESDCHMATFDGNYRFCKHTIVKNINIAGEYAILSYRNIGFDLTLSDGSEHQEHYQTTNSTKLILMNMMAENTRNKDLHILSMHLEESLEWDSLFNEIKAFEIFSLYKFMSPNFNYLYITSHY